MGIRFVIGRAGSGKTKRCFDAIVSSMCGNPLGKPIFWLLPRQATFTAERELACNSGLKGFARAQVLSFDELGSRVLADCGGAAIPHVTELGRQMVLGHLLRQHEPELRYFKAVARQAGLAAELDEIFAEMERCGKTADDLAALLRDFESTATSDHQDQSLLAKMHDLRLLYDAYAKYLGQERLDPHRRLAHVLGCIQNWQQMQGAAAYVDGFLEFTDYERRVITAMAKSCRTVEITLMLEAWSPVLRSPHTLPDEMSPFYRIENAYRKLWFILHEEGLAIEEPIILHDIRRFDKPALHEIESNLLNRQRSKASGDGISLIEAADRRSEVDSVARQIRSWTRDGLRYRDIVVLARDLSEYHELIDASFREHDIPHFVDRRRAATHHPLLGVTRAVFLIAIDQWQHDAMMSLIKSGLGGLSFDEADELENYVLLHRIRGNTWAQPEPWTFRRNVTRGREDEVEPHEIVALNRIDSLRKRVVEKLLPIVRKLAARRPLSIREIVIDLFQTYERFGVRERLLEWMDAAEARNDLEQHDEHAQVWGNLVELFDQMVDLMGDEPVKPGEFLDILEFGLERFDLGLTPPTVDQVLVGSVERTRNPQVRAAVLVGMNDGQFPRVARESSILSDSERKTLRQRRMELDFDAERKLFDENLLAYIGLTRASSYLTLTRAIADAENRSQAPSPYWQRVVELFPQLKVDRIARESAQPVRCIGTPRQLITRLMRWARENPQPTPQMACGALPALYQWLTAHDCCDDAIDIMRFRGWRALSYTNEATLSSATATGLFGSPLKASVSRIESFATCPYQHFAAYGLRLQQREEEDVTAIDLGNVYHQVLEQIVREMIQARRTWTDVPVDQSDAAIKRYATQIGQTLRGELMLSSARNKYLLQRIERTLSQVIASHQAAAQRSRLRPLAAELEFGMGKSTIPALELSTPRGNRVRLYGKIDRVDLIEDQAAFAVIDYKLRGSTLKLQEVYHGLSLQLLTYLLVLETHGEKLAGKKLTPAAAFYVRLLRRLERAHHPDDVNLQDPLLNLQETPRGIFDANYVDVLDTTLEPGSSKVIKAFRKTDQTLGNKGNTDFAERDEFAAMLLLVRRKIGELADEIIGGRIEARPYRIVQQSPCSTCAFQSVCRFDVATNSYNPLEPLKREQVLLKAMEEQAHGR